MKKINILIPLIIIIVIGSNVYYYINTYQLQVNFQKNFLLKQTQISGYEIEKTGQDFLSDLNFILFSENINRFFTDPVAREEVARKIEIFYTKYQDLIIGIALYDTQKHAFTFYKDDKNKRISNIFITREQKKLAPRDQVRFENGRYRYYLPVFSNNQVNGNIVVTLDYIKFISTVFEKSHLGDIQWQWLLDNKGRILFNNLHADSLRITEVAKIANEIANGYSGTIVHKVYISGEETTVISAYYSTNFLSRDFGIIFSLQTDIILRTIKKNAIILASLTFLLIVLIIILFIAFNRQKEEKEKELQQSEDNLRTVLARLPIGAIVLDKKRRILFVNKAAHTMFSVSGDPMEEGRSMEGWFFEARRSEIQSLSGLQLDMSNFLILRKEDTEWVVLREEIPITFRNRDAVLYTLIDVTPLVKARRQEAAAIKAKTEMMLTMNQEIRLPLTKILEKTRDLVESGAPPDKKFLEEIRYSTDLLTSIVDDILTFSKLEAGKMMIEEIPFKLRHELKLVFNKYKPRAKEKGLRILTVFEENVPNDFIGDPFKIRQILGRLIENAIEYTDKGEIRIRVFTEQVEERKLRLCFDVTDTGRGMTKEQKTLFNQKKLTSENSLPGQDKPKAPGGLGISIVTQLTEMISGEVYFTSPATLSEELSKIPDIGPGTTATVKMPLFLDKRIEKELDVDHITDYSQIRVLMIQNNDEPDNYIREYLRHFGVQTTLNFYMEKTVQLISNNAESPSARYHILIIKDSLTFDGFDLLHKLTDRGLISRYLTILISSNDKKGNYAKARKMGVDYYLIDPVQGSELFNILQDNFPHIEMQRSNDISLEEISRSIRILVAEDNLVNQKMMQGFFKNLGFEIDLAIDGVEAVKKAVSQAYDLILMDVMMPNMDGWEATRTLRKKGITIPIVAVTADVTEDAEQRSRDSGMDDYITKPVRPQDIKKLLIKWLSRGQRSSGK